MTHQPALKFSSKPKREYPEQRLQQAIVSICHMQKLPKVMFHSNVNEGKRGYVDGSNLKRAGMTAGVADLEFIINGVAHFMEVKAAGKLDDQSDAQKAFQNDCVKCGVPYAIIDNIGDALGVLKAWGAIRNVRVMIADYGVMA